MLLATGRASGLAMALSEGLASWRPARSVHDPGKVVLDLAVAIALGGDCLADIGVLRAQPELFGPVASDPTVSRLLEVLAEQPEAAVAADRVAQPQLLNVGHEGLDPRSRVAADQHPGAHVLGQLREGGVEHRDLVSGIVGVRCPGPQQPGQRLTRAAGTVVDEGQHRVEPEPAFEGRTRLLLLRVRPDQSGIEIDDHLTLVIKRGPVRPDSRAGLRPRRTDPA